MKIPLRHLPLAVLALSFFLACNNTKSDDTPNVANNKPSREPTNVRDIDCSTIGNFLVSQEVAEGWIERFKTDFRRDGTPEERTGLENKYWIDACIINSFKDFFDKNTGYDGARIHMIAVNGKTEIVLVPTVEVAPPYKHQNIWAVDVPVLCDGNQEFRNVNRRRGEVRTPQYNFEVQFRGRPAIMDSLSSGVWFSKCVFDSLHKYLNDGSLGLDGIHIYLGAYDKEYAGTNQLKPKQSTFVIVVTKPGAGQNRHEDDWATLEKIYGGDDQFNKGAYNHGELCPKNCPEMAEP